MPLRKFFLDQQTELLDFLSSQELAVCLLTHASDMRQLVNKSLLALDDLETHAHILLYVDQPWQSESEFYKHLLERLEEQADVYRSELAAAGIRLPDPLTSGGGDLRTRLIRTAETLVGSIPADNCTLAFICTWDELSSVSAAADCIANFAAAVRSSRMKLIVFDDLSKPRFAQLADDQPRVCVQQFHLAMDKVEQQVNATLATEQLVGLDRVRYLGMAGAFAAAHRRHEESEQRQTEILKLLGTVDSPADEAMAYYNMGNSYLNRQLFTEAEANLGRAAEICLAQKMNPLLAMVLTNLGVTLHRQQRLDESLQCLEIARRTFAVLDNRPGEAYVLDCRANILGLENQIEPAEQSWRQALACYDSISNPTMADVKRHGREDILVKLTRYMEQVGRKERIRDLVGSEGAA